MSTMSAGAGTLSTTFVAAPINAASSFAICDHVSLGGRLGVLFAMEVSFRFLLTSGWPSTGPLTPCRCADLQGRAIRLIGGVTVANRLSTIQSA
jgi:hypothetical protein